ncbi:hypothetical protein VWM66_10785, partial [Campylobacter jejuni]
LSLYPYLDIGNLCHLVLKTHTKLKQKERKDYAFSYFQKLGFEPFLSMELVPYQESRIYGKKVLANYIVYRHLLNDSIKISDI